MSVCGEGAAVRRGVSAHPVQKVAFEGRQGLKERARPRLGQGLHAGPGGAGGPLEDSRVAGRPQPVSQAERHGAEERGGRRQTRRDRAGNWGPERAKKPGSRAVLIYDENRKYLPRDLF